MRQSRTQRQESPPELSRRPGDHAYRKLPTWIAKTNCDYQKPCRKHTGAEDEDEVLHSSGDTQTHDEEVERNEEGASSSRRLQHGNAWVETSMWCVWSVLWLWWLWLLLWLLWFGCGLVVVWLWFGCGVLLCVVVLEAV